MLLKVQASVPAVGLQIACTLACTFRSMLHKLLTLTSATVAILGAPRPLGPLSKIAVFFACLHITSLRLRCRAARLSSILHCPLHLTHALLHTTTTFCTALAPATPSRNLAVN